MTKQELLQQLKETKTSTSRYFGLTEADLTKTYGEGKWSVKQILHHLTDTELLLYMRFKTVIAEPKQDIRAFKQDDWDKAFNYKNEPLKNKKQVYEVGRDMNYELIERYYDEYWQKEFIHSETGLRTLKMEFEKLASHNQDHLEQITIALK